MSEKSFNLQFSQMMNEREFTFRLLAKRSEVSESTLKRWASGKTTPRYWWQVIKVAIVFDLTQIEADQVLTAAGYPSISQLKREHHGLDDVALLSHWRGAFLVPPQPGVVIGRISTLTELSATLTKPTAPRIALLQGMGGVGKTTLALHLAHTLRQQFRDGVLWATIKDDSEAHLHQLLMRFSRAYALGLNGHLPVDELSQRIQTALEDKQVLIILDDVRTRRQIDLLRPVGQASALLLTARSLKIGTPFGTEVNRLKSFEQADTMALFQKYLGQRRVAQEQAAFVAIAELIGNLPLAATIIAQQLALEPERMATDFLETELRPESARWEVMEYDDYSVRASFNLSYQQLSPARQRYFAELGVFEGQAFSAEAAAHVLNLSSRVTTSFLRDLHYRALLEKVAHNRYQLLSQFARDFLSGRVHYTRKVDYYINYARTHQYDEAALFAELENIRMALIEAQEQKIERSFIEGTLVTYAVFYDYGLYQNAYDFLRTALSMARQGGQSREIAALLTGLALLAARRGQQENAERFIQEAEPWADDEVRVKIGRIRALLVARHNLQTGIEQYRVTLEEAERIGAQHEICLLAYNLGQLYIHVGALDSAESTIEQALSAAKKIGNKRFHCLAVAAQGTLVMLGGDYQQAQKIYSHALELGRQVNNPRDLVMLYLRDGYFAFVSGDDEMATDSYNTAIDYATRLQDPLMQLYATESMAQFLIERGHYAQAKKWLDQGATILAKHPHKIGDTMLSIQKGQWLIHTNINKEKGKALLEHGLQSAQELGDREHCIMACLALGEVTEDARHFEAVLRLVEVGGFSAEKTLAQYGLARIAHKNGDPTAIRQVKRCYDSLKKMGHYQAEAVRVWLNLNR